MLNRDCIYKLVLLQHWDNYRQDNSHLNVIKLQFFYRVNDLRSKHHQHGGENSTCGGTATTEEKSKNTPAQFQNIATQIKMRGGSVFGGLECVYLICAHRANTGLATWRKSPVKRSVLSSCLSSYRRVSTSTLVPHHQSPSCCVCHSGTCGLLCHSGLLSSICAGRSATFLEICWMLGFK